MVCVELFFCFFNFIFFCKIIFLIFYAYFTSVRSHHIYVILLHIRAEMKISCLRSETNETYVHRIFCAATFIWKNCGVHMSATHLFAVCFCLFFFRSFPDRALNKGDESATRVCSPSMWIYALCVCIRFFDFISSPLFRLHISSVFMINKERIFAVCEMRLNEQSASQSVGRAKGNIIDASKSNTKTASSLAAFL